MIALHHPQIIIRNVPRIVALFVLAASVAIYALQLRLLYTVPVPDGIRWGGDETWLMREFGHQASHGAMAYPESFGPARTDGVLAGSMWFNAAIYGIAGNSYFPAHDLVSVGRTITALLGLGLIFSLVFLLHRLRVHPLLATGAVALLVIDQGFVWATHSVRYDLVTGLALLWYCYYAARVANRERFLARDAFLFGFTSITVLIFSRHMLTLSFPVTLLALWSLRLWRDRTALATWVAGAISAGGLLSLAYWLGAGEFSLFGKGGSMGSFSFVLVQIPILRPFSRNVQVSNLVERINLFGSDIPGLIVLILAALLLAIGYKLWQWWLIRNQVRLKIATTPEQRFFLGASILCSASWLLLEGSRPYYLFHIVPLFVVSGTIVLQLWMDVFTNRWIGPALATAVLVAGLLLDIPHAIPSTTLGDSVARDQKAALDRLLGDTPAHSQPKSRILMDVAGLHYALLDTTRQVLTLDMFQPPAEAGLAVQKLRANRIDFVVLRSSPVSGAFEPGRALLPHVLDSIGIVRDSALGFFYDEGRSYDASLSQLIEQGLDTLRLYDIRANSATP